MNQKGREFHWGKGDTGLWAEIRLARELLPDATEKEISDRVRCHTSTVRKVLSNAKKGILEPKPPGHRISSWSEAHQQIILEFIGANQVFVSPKDLWLAFQLREQELSVTPFRGNFGQFQAILRDRFHYSMKAVNYTHPKQFDTQEKVTYFFRFLYELQIPLPVEFKRTKLFFLDECFVARGGK
jgi:hypothetical protein